MSWYKGEAVDGTTFVVKDQQDGAWIMQRPTRDIFLQSGRVARVKDASYEILFECLQVQLEEVHGIGIGQEVWFTLPEFVFAPPASAAETPSYSPIAAASTDYAVPSYPGMPGGAKTTPAEEVRKRMQQGGGGGGGGGKRRNKKGKGGKQNSHDDHSDDDNAHHSDEELSGMLGDVSEKYRAQVDVDEGGSSSASSPTSSSSRGLFSANNRKLALFSLLVSIVDMGMLAANLEVCIAIGDSATNWLFVLLWSLLGILLFLAVQVFLIAVVVKNLMGASSYSRVESLSNMMTFGSIIAMVIVVNAFGVPAAWAQAQITAADRYLLPGSTKNVGCWRNPNEVLTQGNAHFVFVSEPQWMVDWADRRVQKMHTEKGTDDEGKDNGKRYNFCVAPIKYTGNVPCGLNMWAVCFRETTWQTMASCEDVDAATCGWQYPVNGMTLRVLNTREQFWRVEQEDIDLINKALAKTTQTSSVPPVLVGVGFEGPAEIEDFQEKAEKVLDGMRIGAYTLMAVVCLILAFISYLETDGISTYWD